MYTQTHYTAWTMAMMSSRVVWCEVGWSKYKLSMIHWWAYSSLDIDTQPRIIMMENISLPSRWRAAHPLDSVSIHYQVIPADDSRQLNGNQCLNVRTHRGGYWILIAQWKWKLNIWKWWCEVWKTGKRNEIIKHNYPDFDDGWRWRSSRGKFIKMKLYKQRSRCP